VAEEIELIVPDLGDFSDVEVIEILVSTHAGVVLSIDVNTGDKVSAGDKVVTIEAAADEAGDIESTAIINPKAKLAEAAAAPVAEAPISDTTHSAQLVVIGSGPGGYTAAFRAADLGLQVTLIERYPVLGGVCLNVGCIPSKALLHAAKVIDEAEAMAEHGVKFGKPTIDAVALRGWKNEVVGRLTGGIAQLAKQRKVKVVQGVAKFASANHLVLDNGETIGFEKCIIAAGSESAQLPGLPDDPRIVDSTGALELDPLPKRMLVVGGGIIGLEMACVYSALGTQVSVVELTNALMPGTDPVRTWSDHFARSSTNVTKKSCSIRKSPACMRRCLESKCRSRAKMHPKMKFMTAS